MSIADQPRPLRFTSSYGGWCCSRCCHGASAVSTRAVRSRRAPIPALRRSRDLKRKLLWTTLVSAVIFAACYEVYVHHLVTLEGLMAPFGGAEKSYISKYLRGGPEIARQATSRPVPQKTSRATALPKTCREVPIRAFVPMDLLVGVAAALRAPLDPVLPRLGPRWGRLSNRTPVYGTEHYRARWIGLTSTRYGRILQPDVKFQSCRR